tara:strand:- start:9149 stop:10300 length:1152 start_codon:yes stop_codon:yes gene_type:complete
MRIDVDTTKAITHLSLCSGYEGIGLGLRSIFTNIREIAYVEREGFPIANLVAKMEQGLLDPAPIYTDVKTFPYRKFRGCVDILSGGFPCQPFSAAGKRQATEDPRHLFPYIRDGIRDCQPEIVFLENVAGIISARTGDGDSVLKYVLKELESLGYRSTAGIFSAEEVGAPHQRKRVFIMGYATSGGCSEVRDGQNSRATSKGEINIGDGEGGQAEGWMQESERRCNATTKLAHSQNLGRGGWTHRDKNDSDGVSEHETPEQSNLWGEAERCSRNLRGEQKWPSRPTEPQHDWEAPRVISNSEGKQSASRNNGGKSKSSGKSKQGESRGRNSGLLRESDGQAKSRLGRTADGSADRVDRLRLLGNGVVPATAATAFKVLINRIV